MTDAPLDATPAAFPLDLHPDRAHVRLVSLTEADYAAASFLDARILPSTGEGRWAAWDEVERFADGLAAEADFIFHMGHVGSTLLSRILGGDDRIFSLREPALLRTLTAQGAGTRLTPTLRLLARPWRPSQRALIKATSFVSDLGPAMMGTLASSRAILMVLPPVAFVSALLGGEATRPDLRLSGADRLARLHRRLGREVWRLENLSDGELAAMTWVGEALALADIAARFPTRTLWLDFDRFLAAPAGELAACLTLLHGSAPSPAISAMLASLDFGRYSKSPDHPYDARLRARLLAESRMVNAEEIERALTWMNAAGRGHAPIAEAARAVAGATRR